MFFDTTFLILVSGVNMIVLKSITAPLVQGKYGYSVRISLISIAASLSTHAATTP
jgi:hypothetical protein